MGSGAFLFMMIKLSLITNILFDAICLSLYLVGMPEALFWNCSGFWTILFALITIECMQVLCYFSVEYYTYISTTKT